MGLTTPILTLEFAVHSVSASDAQFVSESGAKWVSIDVNGDFSDAVANAKADNLRVLGILDSWMFNQSTVFTLDDWVSNVTYYVSQNNNVDAWEIWNEPTNPNYPLLNLNIQRKIRMRI